MLQDYKDIFKIYLEKESRGWAVATAIAFVVFWSGAASLYFNVDLQPLISPQGICIVMNLSMLLWVGPLTLPIIFRMPLPYNG